MVKEGLLFISYYFPPTKSIAAVRNYNISSALLKYFDIYVFTTKNQNKFKQDTYPNLGIRSLKKIFTLDLRTFFPQRQLKSKVHSNNSSSLFHKVLRSFPFNIFLGIGGIFYIFHGLYSAYRYTKRHNISVLYSSYFPYSDLTICFLLKLLRRDLKWIADFRDLHYYPNNDEIVLPRIQKFFNKKILSKATLVTTVSEGLKKHLTEFNDNVIVVRNSIGSLNHRFIETAGKKKSANFQLAYTGNIIPGKSEPKTIFKILKELKLHNPELYKQINFKYAGAYSKYFSTLSTQFGVAESCNILKTVPLSESIKIQNNASINILLSFNYQELQGILTGKFYEYLSVQNPILLIINGRKDLEFEQIFEELNCGLVLYLNDPNLLDKAIKFIDYQFQYFKVNGKSPDYDTEKLVEYTSEFQVQKIIDHLEKL